MAQTDKNKRSFGSYGEELALEYLANNNYKIINRNFRYGRLGEIDIVAWESGYLCFVEVKTRTNTEFGTPAEAVTYRKQKIIRKISQVFISRYNMHDKDIRYDIAEVYLSKEYNKTGGSTINIIKNAF